MPNPSPRRLPMLDALRGLAILLVLGRHMPEVPDGDHSLLVFLRAWQRGGWIGVDLFFVLSGFLVSGLLFREWGSSGRLDPARFLIRRGFKIYPGFYLLLAVTAFLIFTPVSLPHFLSEALFVRNYFMSTYGYWEHTWTLAIEEHFYFGLVLLCGLLIRLRPLSPFTLIPWISAALAVFCLAGRLYGHAHPKDLNHLFFSTHLRIDSLSFGVLLSYFYHHHRDKLRQAVERLKPWLFPAAVLSLLCPFFFDLREYFGHYMWGLTVLYAAFGYLLLVTLFATQASGAVSGRLVRGLAFIGFYSYSIYLWHAPVKMIVRAMVYRYLEWAPNWPRDAALFGVFSLCVGVAMSVWVERPMLKLRDRLFASRTL